MFTAQFITQLTDMPVAFLVIVVFLVVDIVGSAEDDVIMWVSLIRVGSDNI